mmetsp:Transcript_22098/g.39640  ORF Transcript_22098/g.39640 Transcript_22098/m.39640 type:complete len:201 (-) Transcript_22098:2158-2760(-)
MNDAVLRTHCHQAWFLAVRHLHTFGPGRHMNAGYCAGIVRVGHPSQHRVVPITAEDDDTPLSGANIDASLLLYNHNACNGAAQALLEVLCRRRVLQLSRSCRSLCSWCALFSCGTCTSICHHGLHATSSSSIICRAAAFRGCRPAATCRTGSPLRGHIACNWRCHSSRVHSSTICYLRKTSCRSPSRCVATTATSASSTC